MRKLLLALFSTAMIANIFAYKFIVDNKTSTDFKFTSRALPESEWCIVAANAPKTCNLSSDVVYDIKYQPKKYPQRLFTLQQDQHFLQINMTPEDDAPGRINFHVDITKSPDGTGDFNNLIPQTISGKICKPDPDGVTCILGAATNISDKTTIKATITEVTSQ